MIEVPERFYVFVSGKNKGKVAELYMFDKYSFLVYMLYRLREEWSGKREKNFLHKHLEWLLRQGETRQTKMLCPQCGLRTVKFFSVRYCYERYDFSIGTEYTCCENNECINTLQGKAMEKIPEFMPFKFSNLLRFEKSDRPRVVRLFRQAFCLPERLRREEAFKFFLD